MRSKGSTFIELMIVVAIIGFVAGLGIPTFLMYRCRTRGNELNLNKDLTQSVCSTSKLSLYKRKIFLEEIANGTKKAHFYLSDDTLRELVKQGVDVEVPIKEPKQKDQCVPEEAVIKELRLQINQLKKQPSMQKFEKEMQSWRK